MQLLQPRGEHPQLALVDRQNSSFSSSDDTSLIANDKAKQVHFEDHLTRHVSLSIFIKVMETWLSLLFCRLVSMNLGTGKSSAAILSMSAWLSPSASKCLPTESGMATSRSVNTVKVLGCEFANRKKISLRRIMTEEIVTFEPKTT